MDNRFKNRRKNYFINKKFQRKFIIKFCTIVIIGAVISGSIIYAMSRSTVTTSFVNSRLTIKSTAGYILPALLLGSAVVIVLASLATVAVTLFTSHSIAGPLYRIERDIEEVVSGNLKKKFSLRQNDEIKPLAASLDNMTKVLRSEIDQVKRGVYELEGASSPEEAKNKANKLKETLNKFTT